MKNNNEPVYIKYIPKDNVTKYYLLSIISKTIKLFLILFSTFLLGKH